MTALCITGSRSTLLEPTFWCLTDAGMADARPLSRDAAITLPAWQKRALAALDEAESDSPSRFWEQLAADLLLANLDVPLWGWADSNSVPLLDFWADFEPSIRFVLVCETPRQAIEHLLRFSDGKATAESMLQDWETRHQAMLRFHLRHPKRSALLWAPECGQSPQALVEHLRNRWSLRLQDIPAAEPSRLQADPIASHIAAQIVAQFPHLQPLERELLASVESLTGWEPAVAEAQQPDELIASYRSLSDRVTENAILAAAEAANRVAAESQLANALGERERLVQEMAALAEERDQIAQEAVAAIDAGEIASSLASERYAVIETLRGELDASFRAGAERQAEVDEVAQAYADALEQIDAKDARLAALGNEMAALVAACEAAVKAKRDAQKELERCFVEIQTHTKTAAEQKAAIDQLNAQIKTERDASTKAAAAAKTERDAVAKSDREALAKLDQSLKAKTAEIDATKAQLKEAQEEGELLLSQLHQVQEELERYFLENQTHTKTATERQAQIEQLTKARDAAAQQVKAKDAQLAELTKDKADLTATRDSLAKEKTAAQTARDAATKTAAEQKAVIDQLNAQLKTERDASTKGAAAAKTERDAASKADREALAKLDQALKAKTAEIDATKAQLKEAQEEGELLLSQLHQVQEELERYFLDNQAHAKTAAEQKAAIDQLNAQLKTERDAANKARDAATQQVKAKDTQIAALTKEKAELAAARDSLAKDKRAEVDATTAHLKKSQEEVEILLRQLNQAHEEVEHYFLRYKEGEEKLRGAEQRWQRMLQTHPEFLDYDSITVQPVKGRAHEFNWRVLDLVGGGRSVPQIDFTTVVENGVLGFQFARGAKGESALLRWPERAKDTDTITLLPMGIGPAAEQRIQTLLELSTTDWQLLRLLSQVVQRVLTQPALQPGISVEQAKLLGEAREKFEAIVAKLPTRLRFDSVSLKREQVNPDYEHLWLRVVGLSFGDRASPEFEFRVSCAGVTPDSFGTHPKLEFPEKGGKSMFDAWFVESHDDFGNKCELRFALPDALDITVLGRLSERDRTFLIALTRALPDFLQVLKSAGAKIYRPWPIWAALVEDIQRILAMHPIQDETPKPKAPEAATPALVVASVKAPAPAPVVAPVVAPAPTSVKAPKPAPAEVVKTPATKGRRKAAGGRGR